MKPSIKSGASTGRAAESLYRRLPSVDEVLRMPQVATLAESDGAAAVTVATRAVIDRLRGEIGNGLAEQELDLALSTIDSAVELELRRATQLSLRAIINATGVILHTNLGRAPLSQNAIAHIAEIAGTYSNLEFDLAGGERGKRDVHAQRLLTGLLRQASGRDVHSVVVNNCAAAVLLALNSLAEGGEVIVSRGELVEIGGSFRVPDVMEKSQAILREVGTTNRTRLADYDAAITNETRLLLRVHRSNFAIVGFTEQPSLEELVALGRNRGIPVMEDLGNGALVDLRSFGISGEGGVADSLRAGVGLVTYSGDKLLGGPQAGLLSGDEALVRRVRANPMFRALRADKLTYAALEATLLDYLRGQHDSIPALRMMRATPAQIRERAEALAAHVGDRELRIEVVAGESIIGGGTTPTAVLPTFLLSISHNIMNASELHRALRNADPPIVGRVEDGRLLLDLRAVFAEQDAQICSALEAVSDGSLDHPLRHRRSNIRA